MKVKDKVSSMFKKLNNKKIVIITLCIMVLLLVIGTSVALWTRSFTQSGVNTNTTNCFNVTFSEGNSVSQTNLYPQTDEEGLTNNPYQVTITNTCNIAASYNVVLHKDNTSTLANNHIKVAVDNNTKLLSSVTSKTSSINSSTYTAYDIGLGVVPGNTSKTINIRSWMEENTSKSDGENKTFNYKITIDATANSGTLADTILLLNPINSTIPTVQQFQYGEPSGNSSITGSGSGLFKAQDDDGDSYYFRGEINNNYISFGTFKNDYYYYQVPYLGYGGGYEFLGSDASEAINMCEVPSDFGYDTQEACEQAIEQVRIHSKNDPMIWRIMRINGDGTIRLILDNILEYDKYNIQTNNHKYSGLTYDNTHLCTKANPCTESDGNGYIINSLESFYQSNLSSDNNKMALSNFCNSAEYYSGNDDRITIKYIPTLRCTDPTINYGGVYKLKVGMPTADELLFAGLISVGAHCSDQCNKLQKNYLINNKNKIHAYWTITSSAPSSEAYMYWGLGYEAYDAGGAGMYYVAIRPVINLKSDITVVSGDGSHDHPYVVE